MPTIEQMVEEDLLRAGIKPVKSGRSTSDPHARLIRGAAEKYGLDEDLLRRVIRQESGGNPRAVSPAGAQGVMQLMPATARGLGVRDPFDPAQNIDGGARYLRQQLDAFGGDERLALAAYNAGPGNVRKHGGVPPFRETQDYVARITRGRMASRGGGGSPSIEEMVDQDLRRAGIAPAASMSNVEQMVAEDLAQAGIRPSVDPLARRQQALRRDGGNRAGVERAMGDLGLGASGTPGRRPATAAAQRGQVYGPPAPTDVSGLQRQVAAVEAQIEKLRALKPQAGDQNAGALRRQIGEKLTARTLLLQQIEEARAGAVRPATDPGSVPQRGARAAQHQVGQAQVDARNAAQRRLVPIDLINLQEAHDPDLPDQIVGGLAGIVGGDPFSTESRDILARRQAKGKAATFDVRPEDVGQIKALRPFVDRFLDEARRDYQGLRKAGVDPLGAERLRAFLVREYAGGKPLSPAQTAALPGIADGLRVRLDERARGAKRAAVRGAELGIGVATGGSATIPRVLAAVGAGAAAQGLVDTNNPELTPAERLKSAAIGGAVSGGAEVLTTAVNAARAAARTKAPARVVDTTPTPETPVSVAAPAPLKVGARVSYTTPKGEAGTGTVTRFSKTGKSIFVTDANGNSVRDPIPVGRARVADGGGGPAVGATQAVAEDLSPPAASSYTSETFPAPPPKNVPGGGLDPQSPPSAEVGSGGNFETNASSNNPLRIQPDPLPGGTTKRTQEMVVDLGKALGRKIQVGQPNRGALGTYYPGTAKTVVRFSGDLDVTSHEVAHALDDQFGVVGSWATHRLSSPYDGELFQPAFQQSTRAGMTLMQRRAEGVAEWTRAYLVNPDEARRLAPTFHDHFKSKVDQRALAALDEFSNDIRAWAGMPASKQTLANVRTRHEEPPIAQKLREAWSGDPGSGAFSTNVRDRVASTVLDDLWPVMKGIGAAKRIGGVGDLAPSLDPALRIRLHAGHVDRVRAIIENGPVDAQNKPVAGLEGGLRGLLEPFDQSSEAALRQDMDDTVALMVSQRVLEKARRITAEGGDGETARISGVGAGLLPDTEVARRTLAELEADPDRLARLTEGAERYRKWGEWVLDYLAESGRLSPDAVKTIKDENEFYVAMHRVMDELDIQMPRPQPSGKRLGSSAEVVKKFSGSARTIENPYVSLMAQTAAAVKEADRNHAMKLFRDLLVTDRVIYKGPVQDLASIGAKASAEDSNTIKIYVDGEAEYWKFAPDIYRSLKGWGEIADRNILTQLAGVIRWSITHAPDFIVRNFMRDSVERSVKSRTADSVGDHLLSVFKGVPELHSKEGANALRLSGGGQAGHYITDQVAWHKELERQIRRAARDRNTALAFPEQMAKLGSALLEGAGQLGENVELANRLAEFKQAREHAVQKLGYTDLDADLYAAGQSRDLLDFAVAGSFIRKLNAYVPFTNAQFQALARTARGAVGEGKKPAASFFIRWGLYVLAPTLVNYAWNRAQGDENLAEYRQLPAYLRDFFWNYKAGKDSDLWLRLPKPYELALLASLTERLIDWRAGNPHAGDGFGRNAVEGVLPVDEEVAAGPLRPFVEALMNYDMFRQRNIVSPFEQDLDLDRRTGDDNASRLGKELQKVLWVDARKLDHLIHGFFGGLGRAATTASDLDRPDKRRNQLAQGINTAAGLATTSPGFQAVDVQHVLRRAAGRGEEQSRHIAQLKDRLEHYNQSASNAERDRRARELRRYAGRLREYFDGTELKVEELGRVDVTKEPRERVDRALEYLRMPALYLARVNPLGAKDEPLDLPAAGWKAYQLRLAGRLYPVAERMLYSPSFRKSDEDAQKSGLRKLVQDARKAELAAIAEAMQTPEKLQHYIENTRPARYRAQPTHAPPARP